MDARPTPDPPWPDDRCPAWCTREHDASDHPEDRFHHDDGVVLTGVLGRVTRDSLRREDVPASLVVQRRQWPGQDRVWIVLAADEGPDAAVTIEAGLARELGSVLLHLD